MSAGSSAARGGGGLLERSALPRRVLAALGARGRVSDPGQPFPVLSTKGTRVSSGTRAAVEQPQMLSRYGVAASLSFLGPPAAEFWQNDRLCRRTVEL